MFVRGHSHRSHADIVQDAQEDEIRRLGAENDIARIAQRVDQQVQQFVAAGRHKDLIDRNVLARQGAAVVFVELSQHRLAQGQIPGWRAVLQRGLAATRIAKHGGDSLLRLGNRQRNLVDKPGCQRDKLGCASAFCISSLMGWLAAEMARLLNESTDDIGKISGQKTAEFGGGSISRCGSRVNLTRRL